MQTLLIGLQITYKEEITMKKLTVLIAVLILMVSCSCQESEDIPQKNKVVKEQPIKRITTIDRNSRYEVLVMDGHHYISNRYEGGIVHSESCGHTKHKDIYGN